MGSVGQQMLQGYGQTMKNNHTQNVNFTQFLLDLEDEINETRKELNFCKKEVQILNNERDTVYEMAQTKCEDIDKYLNKEVHYLEELIHKAQVKQKAENSRFQYQCQQVKEIANELDDHRLLLVKRVMNVSDHLGIDTGPLNTETISLSGNHPDVAQINNSRQ